MSDETFEIACGVVALLSVGIAAAVFFWSV